MSCYSGSWLMSALFALVFFSLVFFCYGLIYYLCILPRSSLLRFLFLLNT